MVLDLVYKFKSYPGLYVGWFGWFVVFNATFNNISVISWPSVLLVEETGEPRENQRSNSFKMLCGLDCQNVFGTDCLMLIALLLFYT
jgi:hypothetical protein